MSQIVSIFSASKKNECGGSIKNFEDLLHDAMADLNDCRQEDDSKIVADAEVYVRRRINSFLMRERVMDPDLFRCALYISAVVAKSFSSVPESYHVSDYFVKGHTNNDPVTILRGADLCFLLCSFFPKRCERRSMRLRDYMHMGTQMYLSFYAMSSNSLGLCIGNNFSDMVEITQKSMKV